MNLVFISFDSQFAVADNNIEFVISISYKIAVWPSLKNFLLGQSEDHSVVF
jgi:hypothetical protein